MPYEFTEDLYAVLGVEREATPDEIRQAGRRRQRETHPDMGGSSEDFVRVQLAIEVLTDERLRREHDQWLDARSRPSRQGGTRTRRQQRPATARPRRREPATRRESTPAPKRTVPQEPPPPTQVPKPDTDARRMGWYRTAWPDEATVWPPAAVSTPGLRPIPLFWVIAYHLVLIGSSLLLALPGSPARLWFVALRNAFATAEWQPVAPLWPLVTLYAALGLAWVWMRVSGRSGALVRTLFFALLLIALVSAPIAGIAGVLAALSVGAGAPAWAPATLFLQSILYLATGLTMLMTSVMLLPRVTALRQEQLLVQLAEEAMPMKATATRVWGAPGASVTAGAPLYPGVNRARAEMAQQIVGEALAELARIPGVRIVHGMRVPGRDAGTVPAAVISGHRIALIDAQMWQPGNYAIDRQGRITANGQVFETMATEFPLAVERYHELLGDGASIRGWITIVPEAAGELNVDNALTWQRVSLATVPSMLREVGNWLAEDGERVDRLLVRDLLRYRIR